MTTRNADSCPFTLTVIGESGSRNWRVAVSVPDTSAPLVHKDDCERCLADAAGEESDDEHEYERDHGNADWPSDERIAAEASRQVGHRVRLVGAGDRGEQGEWVQKIETVPAETEPTFFFDSHGGLWVTCAADTPGAEAFGPAYTARRAAPAEAGLDVRPGETAYAAAARAGRVRRADEAHEWDLLIA